MHFAFWAFSVVKFHSGMLKYFQVFSLFFQSIIRTETKSISAIWNKGWLMFRFVHDNMMLAPCFKPIVIYIKETKSDLKLGKNAAVKVWEYKLRASTMINIHLLTLVREERPIKGHVYTQHGLFTKTVKQIWWTIFIIIFFRNPLGKQTPICQVPLTL